MAEGNDADKTEKPTAQRLRKAREQGHVARSRDLAAALGVMIFGVVDGMLLAVALSIAATIERMARLNAASPARAPAAATR